MLSIYSADPDRTQNATLLHSDVSSKQTYVLNAHLKLNFNFKFNHMLRYMWSAKGKNIGKPGEHSLPVFYVF